MTFVGGVDVAVQAGGYAERHGAFAEARRDKRRGRRTTADLAAAQILVVAAFDFQERIEVGAGLEQNTDSSRLIVVLGLVLAGVRIFLPTIETIQCTGQAHGQDITQGHIHRAFGGVLSELPIQEPGPAAEGIRGFRGHDIECAGDGVVAEKRALRAFEDFDPIHIQECAARGVRAAVIDVIDERTYRLIEGLAGS